MNKAELERIDEVMKFCKDLMQKKSIEYGDCYKECGLGYRSAFVELNAKYFRLKKLLWDDDLTEKTETSVADTLVDLINYCIITLLLIEAEKNKKLKLDRKI